MAPRKKSDRTLSAIAEDIEAVENTLAGLRAEFATREAELIAQRDVIALELGAVCGPKRLTDVDAADAPRDLRPEFEASLRKAVPTEQQAKVTWPESDLTIPAFLDRNRHAAE